MTLPDITLPKKPNIWLSCYPSADIGGVIGYALDDNGVVLAMHLSTNEDYAMHDMGFTSDWKHETYKKRYPGGYIVHWVEMGTPPELIDGFREAYAKNQAMRGDPDATQLE